MIFCKRLWSIDFVEGSKTKLEQLTSIKKNSDSSGLAKLDNLSTRDICLAPPKSFEEIVRTILRM